MSTQTVVVSACTTLILEDYEPRWIITTRTNLNAAVDEAAEHFGEPLESAPNKAARFGAHNGRPAVRFPISRQEQS